MACSSVTRAGGVCGAPCAATRTQVRSVNAFSATESCHFRALNFRFIAALLLENFMSLDAAFGKIRIPGAAREIGRDDFEIGQRRYCRRLRRASYAEGGARGAICEKTGPVAGTTTSSSGSAAIGLRTPTH